MALLEKDPDKEINLSSASAPIQLIISEIGKKLRNFTSHMLSFLRLWFKPVTLISCPSFFLSSLLFLISFLIISNSLPLKQKQILFCIQTCLFWCCYLAMGKQITLSSPTSVPYSGKMRFVPSAPSPTCTVIFFFLINLSHSDKGKMKSQIGFTLHFSDG